MVLRLLLQSFWVAGATVGALAGTRLPLDRLQGLDFALTARAAFPQQMLLAALTLFAGLLVAPAALAGRKPAHA